MTSAVVDLAEDPALTDVQGTLLRHARERGEHVFLRSLVDGRELDFAAADRLSTGVADRLRRVGVAPGDRVALLAENTIECVLVYLACLRAGFVIAPLNAEVNSATVGLIAEDLQPRMITGSAEQRDLMRRLAMGLDSPTLVATYVSHVDPAPGDLFEDLSTDAEAAERRELDPHQPALVTYTSGTTDRPKGVVHSLTSYAHLAEQTLDLTGVTAADRILETRSLSWISAQVISIGSALYGGATAVLAPKFSRSNFFSWIESEQITVAVGVPTAINMLLEEKVDVDAKRLASLRYLTSSSAPLSPDRHREFESHYGIRIQQYYGMSEAGFMAGNREGSAVLGTVGPATKYQLLRVVDTESGKPVQAGTEGEIVVGGPQMALGYWERTGIVPLPDRSTFRTGDLGRVDDAGYLTITGRSKDIVIRGGVNIAPLEITTALLAQPDVVDAGTFGVPDPVYGEELVSYVATRGPADADLVRARLAVALSPFKVPKYIRFIDEIPKTERGKTDVRVLRNRWDAEGGLADETKPAEGVKA